LQAPLSNESDSNYCVMHTDYFVVMSAVAFQRCFVTDNRTSCNSRFSHQLSKWLDYRICHVRSDIINHNICNTCCQQSQSLSCLVHTKMLTCCSIVTQRCKWCATSAWQH